MGCPSCLLHNVTKVAGDFTLAMQSLGATLGASQCSYVRCVKPNSRMQPGLFENHYVATQVCSCIH